VGAKSNMYVCVGIEKWVGGWWVVKGGWHTGEFNWHGGHELLWRQTHVCNIPVDC